MKQTPLILLALMMPAFAIGEEENKEKATVSVSGYLEPVGAAVISPDTKRFAALKIEKIVPHGTKVKKGQAIIWFETDAIDKQIEESELAIRKGELSIAALDIESKQLGELSRLDREAAQRAHKHAQEDYDDYVRTLRAERVESTEASLKSSRYSLENVMEELKQLEQMYKEDELTEESEEIVLKRAKRSVESAQLRLKHAETATARALEKTIPRDDVSREVGKIREQMSFDKQIREIDSKRRLREMEIAAERKSHAKKEKELGELREDRGRMVLKAPMDGVVYHGTFARGKISDKPSALKKGAAATGTQEIVTVVKPSSLQVRLDLPEKELHQVAAGLKATVSASGYPDVVINGQVKSVSAIPMSSGKFDCVVTMRLPKNAPQIVAGMAANVKIEVAEKLKKQ